MSVVCDICQHELFLPTMSICGTNHQSAADWWFVPQTHSDKSWVKRLLVQCSLFIPHQLRLPSPRLFFYCDQLHSAVTRASGHPISGLNIQCPDSNLQPLDSAFTLGNVAPCQHDQRLDTLALTETTTTYVYMPGNSGNVWGSGTVNFNNCQLAIEGNVRDLTATLLEFY